MLTIWTYNHCDQLGTVYKPRGQIRPGVAEGFTEIYLKINYQVKVNTYSKHQIIGLALNYLGKMKSFFARKIKVGK